MVYALDLNITPGGVPPIVRLSQYDKTIPQIEAVLWTENGAYTIPTGSDVFVAGTKPDKTGFEYACSYTGSTVTIDITEQMTAVAGRVPVEVIVETLTGRKGSANFFLDVEPSALADDTIISDTDLQTLQRIPEILIETENFAELAHQWATYGEDSETPSSTNNALYWAKKSQEYAIGALHWKGSVPFANIPATGMTVGDMYNITDAFTTDARFDEGAGISCSAGTNIVWDANGKWDILISSTYASNINFDNTGTEMSATNVQNAITELNTEKQAHTDNNLTTTDKTVTGAINEINTSLTASGCYNRGKDLTPYVVDGTLWDRIHGTNGFEKYEDIMPWDYIDLGKTITAPSSGGGSVTGTSIVRVAQRGGINPYQFGGTPTDCLVMVPDTHFGMSKMNATNDATGGYKSSYMASTILPNINSQLETTNLAGHIVPTIELITNSINASGWGKLGSASGASNSWEWTDGGSGRLAKQKCVLMSEMEVYGGTVFSSSGYDTGNACMQLEAFRNSKDAAMPYTIYFWLKDVASAAIFCVANGGNGGAHYHNASTVHYVRPRFIIS